MPTKRARIHGKLEDQKTLKPTENRVSIIFDLPTAVLHDILFRLRIISIMKLKLVCTSFKKRISHPDFAIAYAKFSPFLTLLIPTKFPSPLSIATRYRYDEHLDLIQVSDNYEITRATLKPKIPRWPKCFPGFYLVGSCNGLICLSLRKDRVESVYVCNPITGESRLLPKRKIRSGKAVADYGFGFCRSINKFKVLRIFRKKGIEHTELDGDILTIGTDDAWRRLANPEIPVSSGLFKKFVILNGTCHWIVKEGDYAWISTFDLEEEKVGQQLSLPHGFVMHLFTKLESINNQLYLLDKSSSSVIIWKMNEYGVAESWTKNIIVDISLTSYLRSTTFVLLTILENGDIVISDQQGSSKFFIYNPIKKKLFQFHCSNTGTFTFNYAPSFLSLEESCNGVIGAP